VNLGALRSGVGVAGLIAGPGAWAVSTQLNYALAPLTCGRTTLIVGLPALALAVLAIIGGVISWAAWQPTWLRGEMFIEDDGRAHKFVAGLGVLSATLFAAVILMQGAAALVLNGCMK
jgi:hypothetical protein